MSTMPTERDANGLDTHHDAGPFDRLGATEDTVVAVLDRLRSEGYDADFQLEPEDVPPGRCCGTCGRRHLPERSTIVEVHRFEGPSSPEDEALANWRSSARDAGPWAPQ